MTTPRPRPVEWLHTRHGSICPRCHALVPPGHTTAHESWHRTHTVVEERVAALTARLTDDTGGLLRWLRFTARLVRTLTGR